ncbi:MAG: chromosome segregation protein SMC [Anaerolineaceae bacterium]|nr:chromosome segregation protein SMC [Anaerolineaceae bacterium]
MIPRLKALELHGYKTFASRFLFEFPGNVTAVVGPNGSGKSNISDSLRWVLGEQSYGMLRGRKTEDMIFSGSDQRPRAGMASASITFDNSEGWLPIDFSEVSIARRAYRDGTNEYYLNGQKVRLKDISELLAQSGLAERTYTMIGQGLVDAALSLRPEERRRFFEEAAGIGLFRSRREESISRLESTRRNLERVRDILSELEPRLHSLERQAQRAEEYDRVKADLNVLLKDWYGYHWHNAQKEMVHAREVVKAQEERAKMARQNLSEVEQNVQASRNHLRELRNQLDEWHGQSAAMHTERERISRILAVMDERTRSMVEQDQSMNSELSRLEEEAKMQAEKLAELLEEKDRLSSDLDDAQKQLNSAQSLLDERQKERDKVESDLRDARRALVNSETQQVQAKAHQRELNNRLETVLETQKNLEGTLTHADEELKAAQKEVTLAQQKKDDTENDLAGMEEALDAQSRVIRELKEKAAALQTKKNQLEAEQARTRAQLDVIIQAEKALSGFANGAKSLMQAASQGALAGGYKVISSLLDVPAEYERAIASVLGENLDGILLDAATDPETALEFLDKDEKGRAVLIPEAWAKASAKSKAISDADVIGVAADLVKCDGAIRKAIDLLLGQVVVVKDRQAARRVSQTLPDTMRAVTLKGEVFFGSGLIIAGQDGRANLVGRPRQRKELQDKVDSLEDELNDFDSETSTLEKKIKDAEEKQRKLEMDVRLCRTQVSTFNSEYQSKSLALEQRKQKLDWQKNQLTTANDQINKTRTELAATEKQISDLQEIITSANTKLRDLNGLLHTKATDEYQAQVVHWNTTLAVSTRAVRDAERRYAEYLQIVSTNKQQQASLRDRIKRLKDQLGEIETEKVSNHQMEATQNGKIEEIQKLIDPAEAELIRVESEYAKLQDNYTALQQTQSTAERYYTQAQLELTRSRESMDNLRRRIEEDFGLVKLEYNDDVSGPTPLPLEGVGVLPMLKEIPNELEDSINRQKAMLRRMGAINPEAQKEYHEVKERYEYLTGQVADLTKADEDLRQIISELDELMRREFKKTFNAVAAEFKQMFTRLFGGGSAKLILTDEEHPTETGIDIEAKLPGRREQGLSLLSGGERSLTAVALIFSLLKVAPTPFCILDEVDAALDEANVGRFTELLKELSDHTQFIVITHNRNTVQVADVIYGVTMGRDSASQVISLRLDEVNEDMVK